jgi:uncharacterized membrane protein SirB2
MYFALKHLHLLCAAISIIGFIVRGALRIQNSPLLQRKWLRIAPHIVDTLLLLSAIGLSISIQQYPFTSSGAWLTTKVLGLLVYIGLGLVTLRFAKTQPVRVLAYVLAIATFSYIGSVAISKVPLPFLG